MQAGTIRLIRDEYRNLLMSGSISPAVQERDFARGYFEQYREMIEDVDPQAVEFAREFWGL